MIKHIKEYLSFYVYGFGYTILIGFFAVSSWLERYEPPVGIVVNMMGEIIKQKDKEKETAQGAEFWQHQLVAVRHGINRPEEISSQHRANEELLNKIQLRSIEVQELVDDVTEKTLEKHSLNTPHHQRVRIAERELSLKRDELEDAERQRRWGDMYQSALDRQPALIELEKIITSKLLKKSNE